MEPPRDAHALHEELRGPPRPRPSPARRLAAAALDAPRWQLALAAGLVAAALGAALYDPSPVEPDLSCIGGVGDICPRPGCGPRLIPVPWYSPRRLFQ